MLYFIIIAIDSCYINVVFLQHCLKEVERCGGKERGEKEGNGKINYCFVFPIDIVKTKVVRLSFTDFHTRGGCERERGGGGEERERARSVSCVCF